MTTTEGRSAASGRMMAAIESEPSQVADDLQLRRGLMPAASSTAASIQNASIMIVDDGPIYIKVVRNILQNAGYERFITTTEAIDALKLMPCKGRTMQQPVIFQPIIKSPVLTMAATIAISHHEKWDGSGYPRGSAGELIPIEGRVRVYMRRDHFCPAHFHDV